MVAILEKIELVIEGKRLIKVNNPFGEKSCDYICENTFNFEKGKIYGIVCEHGGGGESISLLLSDEEPLKQEKIIIDGEESGSKDVKRIGWYVGKEIYAEGFIKKEMSIRKLLEYAINKYHRYERIEDIAEEFGLDVGILDYGLSKNCHWAKWRASLAVGYANNKMVYCFPWLNTMYFYDCLYNSGVFRFFKKLKSEGAIIILPTSRKENVTGIADEIIQIYCPRFENVITDSAYFKEYF